MFIDLSHIFCFASSNQLKHISFILCFRLGELGDLVRPSRRPCRGRPGGSLQTLGAAAPNPSHPCAAIGGSHRASPVRPTTAVGTFLATPQDLRVADLGGSRRCSDARGGGARQVAAGLPGGVTTCGLVVTRGDGVVLSWPTCSETNCSAAARWMAKAVHGFVWPNDGDAFVRRYFVDGVVNGLLAYLPVAWGKP